MWSRVAVTVMTAALGLAVVAKGHALSQEEVRVLPETLPISPARGIDEWRDSCAGGCMPKVDSVSPSAMLAQYLVSEIDKAGQRWDETYESLKTAGDIAAYQHNLRKNFIEAIGGEPERTPLNARVTGEIRANGYRVEKVLFESLPGFYVTGSLFLPESPEHSAPYPGVLVPCGHYIEAKAAASYQTMGALLALNGMVALVFDPIDQGERIQLPGTGINNVAGHDTLGPGSILLGRNTSYFYRWDAVRALDFLAGRPEVHSGKLGCTGNSGGGTQTLLLASSDDRILAVAPSCSLSRMVSKLRQSPGDIEQHVFGQMQFGLDEVDYVMMRAPEARWLICTATHDFVDIHSAWWSYRDAKRLYTRLGFPERLGILEEDAPHSYGKIQREAVARWMALWLQNDTRAVVEPAIDLIEEEALHVTPDGHVSRLPGSRSAYDINSEYAAGLAKGREEKGSLGRGELLDKVRVIAGIRPLEELPPLDIERKGSVAVHGHRAEQLVLIPEEGIFLPALLFTPDTADTGDRVLLLDERGKSSEVVFNEQIRPLLDAGTTVLAVDVRGSGETRPVGDRQDNYNYYRAHDLGRSIMGMRAEDILWSARFLAASNESFSWREAPVVMVACGPAGVAALHAAALEDQLFARVKLVSTLASWMHVVDARPPVPQWSTIAHGALRIYDLPDLVAVLGDKLVIERPMGGNGRPLDHPVPDHSHNLVHRWRFDSEEDRLSEDDAGGAHARLHGAAVIRAGALDLSSNPDTGDTAATGAGWAELPIGDTLASLDTGATFEAWITVLDEHKEAKLWSFGSSANNDVYLYPQYGNGYSHVVAGVRADPNAPWRNAITITPLAAHQKHHLVVTLYGDAWTRELKLYVNGECVAKLDDPFLPAQVSEYAHCFLGRTCDIENQSLPLWRGLIHEFRVYKGAMPYEVVQANYREDR